LGVVPLVDAENDIQKKMAQSTPNYKDGHGRDASGKRSLDAAMTKKERKLKKKEEMKKKQKLAEDPIARLKAIFEG
jgi:predicted Holliday junction resolvase-like endonuclease